MKTLLLQKHSTNFNQLGTKHPYVKKTQGFTNKDHSILKKEIMGFYSPNQYHDIIIALLKSVY